VILSILEVFMTIAGKGGRPNTKGKTPQHIGSSVTQEVFDRFDGFCQSRGLVKAFVVQKAVTEFMDRTEAQEAPAKAKAAR
jgi:hypothetical protein